jgi:hypothetical protein
VLCLGWSRRGGGVGARDVPSTGARGRQVWWASRGLRLGWASSGAGIMTGRTRVGVGGVGGGGMVARVEGGDVD